MTQKNVNTTKSTSLAVKILVESAIMVAFATVLSLLKLIEMPYGGSVTLASAVPILIISYRHGIKTGLITGAVFAATQQLLGLNNLSYVTGWQSVVAVIMLDYVLAFTVIGLGGIFKGRIMSPDTPVAKRQAVEMACGMALVSFLRYILHTVAGATVWAGLSIPTSAALLYSIGYNATYMIPETIVNVAVAAFIGGEIDFLKATVTRIKATVTEGGSYAPLCRILNKLAILFPSLAAVISVLLVAPYLQDAESGSFTFARLGEMNPTWLIVTLSLGVLLTAACLVVKQVLKRKDR
jgi:thiamine transporter